MKWEFDGDGQWEALSAFGDVDRDRFVWLIQVCEDGTFDVSHSDSELTNRKETFPSLALAKLFCTKQDAELVKSFSESESDPV